MENTKSYLTTGQAAKIAEVSEQAIRGWIDRYGIGQRVAGRFRVDPMKLDAVLNNTVSTKS